MTSAAAGQRFEPMSHFTTTNHSYPLPLARASKNLIVVLPPPHFPLEHGQLDNLGPPHRLSQGILMPIFPTMYGQLTAIAHEFNFPSTVGLCLYQHITESGITMTPRISDNAWQYLWGHLFDSRSPSNGVPISGRVEFDIDISKARWFDAWLAGTLREDTLAPPPQSHPSIHPSNWRGDNRITSSVDKLDQTQRQPFPEEHTANENVDRCDNQSSQSNSRTIAARHVPRKLSLVDRRDSTARQASYKTSQVAATSPDHAAHQLSTIPQSAVPDTGTSKAKLHQHIDSWRVTASLNSPSMAESHQPVPNVALGAGTDEYPLKREAEVQEPLNFAFSQSVTSVGPLSSPLNSPVSPFRLPSVHIDRRIQESVPLTPCTATSWGPDDWLSDMSSVDRLPSPDIGRRMLESVPLTPATATSWGPADDWRSDLSNIDRLPSPDIAHRVLEDALACPVSGAPWHIVWPWFDVGHNSGLSSAGGYPVFDIYPAVYPHFNLYPSVACSFISAPENPTVFHPPVYGITDPVSGRFPS